MVSDILFRINISPSLTTIARLDGAGQFPRSRDLTPMDFFLWGHIKALVCISPFDSPTPHPPFELKKFGHGFFPHPIYFYLYTLLS
jgi:hypothetical protein